MHPVHRQKSLSLANIRFRVVAKKKQKAPLGLPVTALLIVLYFCTSR
jgi:hypothetical protein